MNDLHALLIGVDCYLPNVLTDGASYKSLGGCVRDITHVEAFLKRQFNLPSERIYKLTASNVDGAHEPSEPPEQWPTYENIVGKFKEITEKALELAGKQAMDERWEAMPSRVSSVGG